MFVQIGNRYLAVRRGRVLAPDRVELLLVDHDPVILTGDDASAIAKQLLHLTVAVLTPDLPEEGSEAAAEATPAASGGKAKAKGGRKPKATEPTEPADESTAESGTEGPSSTPTE